MLPWCQIAETHDWRPQCCDADCKTKKLSWAELQELKKSVAFLVGISAVARFCFSQRNHVAVMGATLATTIQKQKDKGIVILSISVFIGSHTTITTFNTLWKHAHIWNVFLTCRPDGERVHHHICRECSLNLLPAGSCRCESDWPRTHRLVRPIPFLLPTFQKGPPLSECFRL